MNKKKKPTKKTKRKKCSPATEDAIAKLKLEYSWGLQVKEHAPRSKTYATGAIDEMAEVEGLSASIIRSRRQFALEYNEAELKALFELMREHDSPIGITHIKLFLRVPDSRREAFQRLVIRKGWSYRRAQLEFRKKGLASANRKRVGGRKPRCRSAADFRAELARVSYRWKRLIDTNQDLKVGTSRLLKGKIRSAYEEVSILLRQLDKIDDAARKKKKQ